MPDQPKSQQDSETSPLPPSGGSGYGAGGDGWHPSVKFFAERLLELRGRHQERVASTGDLRPMSPQKLLMLLAEQAPDLPMSQTQVYRLCYGMAIPKVDLIVELANLFDVSPHFFLPTLEEAREMLPPKRQGRIELP